MKTIITHSGKFHADDVFGVATLVLFLEGNGEEVEIVRTREEEKIEKGDYVVDVGNIYDPDNERFDHHQEEGAGYYENNIPYASFGLVWEKYGEPLCKSKKIADIIRKKMVMHMDAVDNGVNIFEALEEYETNPYTITDVVNAFVPAWNEDGYEYDEGFLEVVEIAKKIILREIQKAQSRIDSEGMVREAFERNVIDGIAVMDCYCPFQSYSSDYPNIYFVVMGSSDESGNYMAQAIKDDNVNDPFAIRKRFPKEWGGKRDEELEEVSGVKGAVFCHKGGFIAVAKTKEGAIELARKALEYD